MKKALIIIALLSSISCSDHEDPTTIRGEVIFPTGFEKASLAKVVIVETISGRIGEDSSQSAVVAVLKLDSNNRFDTTLFSSDVTYYFLGVDIMSADGSGAVEKVLTVGNGMDCVSQECNNLKPGKSYDLTVRVLE